MPDDDVPIGSPDAVRDAALYHRIVETLPQGIMVFDASGRVISANPAAARMLGTSTEELLGLDPVTTPWRLVRADGSPLPVDEHPVLRCLRTGAAIAGVTLGVHRTASDEALWLDVSVEPEEPDGQATPERVVGTFTDVTERVRAERRSAWERELQELLVEVSTTYIDLPPERLDAAIDESLARLGSFVGADRFYVFEYDHEQRLVNNTHEWCANGIEPQIEELQGTPFEMVERWLEVHRRGEAMRIPDVQALPLGDGVRQILEPQGIKSLLAVPLIDGERRPGFIGLDWVREHHQDTAAEERLLRVFAQMLVGVERRRTLQEAAAAQRQFLSEIIENSGAIIYVKDLEGRYLLVNRSWQESIGATREQALGRSDDAFFSPDEARQLRAHDLQVMRSGGLVRFEETLATPAGVRTFLSTKFPHRDAGGAITGVVGMSTDITTRKRAEEVLRRSELRSRTFLDGIPSGLAAVDLASNALVYVNDHFCALLGYDAGELLGRPPSDLHLPSDVDAVMGEFARLARGEVGQARNIRMLRKDGSTVTVDVAGGLGELDGRSCLFGVFNDVGDRVALSAREHARNDILRALASAEPTQRVLERIVALIEESVPEARCSVLVVDAAVGRLRLGAAPRLPAFYNAAIDGIAIGPGVGSCGTAAAIGATVVAEDIEEHPHWEAFRDVARRAGLRSCWSEPICAADGRVLGTFALYHDTPYAPDDETVGYVRMATDLASLALEQQEAHAERVRREVAEAANRAKSTFLANMSHEIRTPLNAVIGFSQLLEHDEAMGSRQREQLRTITRSGEHLLRLINDILDLSKIEAGQLTLVPGDLDLPALLGDLAAMFQPRADAKGLRLAMTWDDALPRFVRVDGAKLRQVLINLVGNALKFTDVGGVDVRIWCQAREHGHPAASGALWLHIDVEDTGPGIQEHERERIFEAFQQGGAGHAAGGTGLGLTITRHLVEVMEGQLSVESRAGHGSRFRVRMPLRAAAAPVPPAPPERRPSALRLPPAVGRLDVLCVDDEPTNRALLRDLLAPLGFSVRDAENGLAALDACAERLPDLVLMDIRMPVMDGIEAIGRIRGLPSGAALPIVAVTASAFEEQAAEVMAAGADAYVRKPFRWSELTAALERVLDLRFVERDAAEPALAAAEGDAEDAAAGEGVGSADHASPEVEAAFRAAAQAALAELETLLSVDDTAALDLYEQHEATLLAVMGEHAVELGRRLREFELAAALTALRDYRGAEPARPDPPGATPND